MPIDLLKQLNSDADDYALLLQDKLKKFQELHPRVPQVPVKAKPGKAYMRGYRKYNGAPFAIRLSRKAIAYLYRHIVQNTPYGEDVSGHLAVGFANYNPEELDTPHDPPQSDPYWKAERAYQNAVMVGLWNEDKGIVPFKVKTTTKDTDDEFFDDWSDEWP